MSALMSGAHTVLASGTASGKSLGYIAPALSGLITDPLSRVLYLAPTKALARDQVELLGRWNAALGQRAVPVDVYDGDTPRSSRAAIRGRARWLFSNPEMLHMGVLPNHAQWASFLANLRLVVLDELHVYRGVFGSHVANVLRRLARLVRFHGGGPLQLAACSATIANPESLARRLLSEPTAEVAVVSGEHAPRAGRHFACVTTAVVNPALGIRRRLSEEVEAVAEMLLRAGVRTIVFVRTRRAAEELVRGLRRLAATVAGVSPREAIRAYRAGLRPAERRSIEKALRSGTVRIVVSTSALELGVDIGPLKAAVLAGYPGDFASLRQQAGRVGRREDGALVVLVAGNGGLDLYVAQRPELLMNGCPEHAQVAPDNALILRDHLRCAVFELPFEQGESLGPGDGALLRELVAAGELRHADGRYFWVGGEAPAPRVGLRSMELRPMRLVRTPGDRATRRRREELVGTLDRGVALAVAHPGALYVHDGHGYRVTAVDWEEGRAELRASTSQHVTVSTQEHALRLVHADAHRAVAVGDLQHGPTELVVTTVGYRELEPATGSWVAEESLELPELRRTSAAYWLTLSESTVERLRAGGWWRPDPVGYRGPDWQAQRRRARERDGCRCVHCGVTEQDRQHDIHHLRPFRDFGYVRGENQAYRAANQLDNLVTLCRVCHARAENGQRFQGALERLAYLIGNVAPLVLMCDPRDLELRVWRQRPDDGGVPEDEAAAEPVPPSLVIAERTPAGVGFAEALFGLHEELVAHARELVRRCDCTAGCPACVGPSGEEGGEEGPDGRAFARAILAELGGAGEDTP